MYAAHHFLCFPVQCLSIYVCWSVVRDHLASIDCLVIYFTRSSFHLLAERKIQVQVAIPAHPVGLFG
jgi:hypothetical protein